MFPKSICKSIFILCQSLLYFLRDTNYSCIKSKSPLRMNSYKYSLFYEVRQSRAICRENISGNPKAVKMVQKHTQNFCKFFIEWIKKKSIPFSTSTPRVPRVTGSALHTDVRSSSSVFHKPSSLHRTETNQQLEKHSLKLVLQGEFPLAMQVCH